MYEKQTEDVKKRKFFLILAFVLLGVFLCFLVCYLLGFFGFSQRDAQISKKKVPKGEIYLTLSPKGEEKPNIYKLDVGSMELEEYLPNEEDKLKMMGKFSSDLEEMVYVEVNEEKTRNSIMIWDNELKEAESVADFTDHLPRNPIFTSDSQTIFFWMFESDDGSNFAMNAEDNGIFMLDRDGSIEHVADGAFPVLTEGDRHLIYIKNDGLYALDLSSREEKLFLFFGLPATDLETKALKGIELPDWLVLRLDYSPVKNIVALTDVSSGIHFSEMDDWESLPADVSEGLGVFNALWPIFSPEGDYLGIQKIVEGKEGLDFSMLRIYDLQSSDWHISYALDLFDSNYIWVTDWIVR